MMPRYCCYLSILLLSFPVFAQDLKVSAAGNTPVEGVRDVDVRRLSIDAMMGSASAASKLSDYYKFERNLDPRWKSWALIAAENGDPGAQFDEYSILAGKKDELSQRRAFYWLKRSLASGFPYAAIEMNSCFPGGLFENKRPGCGRGEVSGH